MKLEREWSMPSRWTFEIDSVSDFLQDEVGPGTWIDPFAGKNSPADITNDLNPDRDTDYNLHADEFLQEFSSEEVDGGILIDPPYNATQMKRLYDDIDADISQNDTNGGLYGLVRRHARRILAPGAKALTFGWSSTGVGKKYGFEKSRILLVCHGSSRNDTICVSETKTQTTLPI